MKDLIIILESIRMTAKDWHYNASGAGFYSSHLQADAIAEPLSGMIDDIKEVCFLGNCIPVPTSKELCAAIAASLLPCTTEADIKTELATQLNIAIYTIEEIAKGNPMQGELNLLGSISEHLQKSKGLLSRSCIPSCTCQIDKANPTEYNLIP